MKKDKTISTTVMVVRAIRSVIVISLISILIVAFASSCGPTVKVTSDYDRATNFSAYRTFYMYDLKSTGNVNELNQDRIEKYIRAEMIKRGFVESKNNPDLMVNAVTVLKNRRGISANTSYYGYGGFYRPYGYWAAPAAGYTSISTYDYKDGSLVIDVVDAKIKRMIWTGSASAEIYKTPKDPDEAISTTVAKIMAEFPANVTNTALSTVKN